MSNILELLKKKQNKTQTTDKKLELISVALIKSWLSKFSHFL